MAERIVVLTGAGISQESGIPTFRGADGLWNGHRIEEVASPEAFRRNPALVHEFYNTRRRQLLSQSVKPNAAHFALAELERTFPGEFLLVTQNVDDLHERAGSRSLIHMHGELLKARCTRSGEIRECREDLTDEGTWRPHIVWFGEMPLEMDRIVTALERCDCFLAIGTSGVVYPAAGFVERAPPGCRRIEVNLEGTPVSSLFDEHRRGAASRIVPELLRELGGATG